MPNETIASSYETATPLNQTGTPMNQPVAPVNETIAPLNLLAAEMSLLKHPFYQAWAAGTLTADRLRNYAVQYYRHVAAFPRYLSGLTREEVLGASSLPATNELIDTFTHLSRDLPPAAGLAALYVYESQVAEVATAKIDGLRRFYGVEDDAGVEFFTTHRDADPFVSCGGGRAADRAASFESGRSSGRNRSGALRSTGRVGLARLLMRAIAEYAPRWTK
ncbi:MAG TPA: iron-containing redox enzyme family protein [Candidatus Binataceae bacterium]|nr:iron-containing redox enzyme family protein [Candidatus Binataceae bacterium]